MNPEDLMEPKKTPPSSPKHISKNKPSDSQFQSEIDALDKENLKLQKQIFKLKAEQFSLKNKIKILEEYTDKGCIYDTPPIKCLMERKQILKAQLEVYEKQKNNR